MFQESSDLHAEEHPAVRAKDGGPAEPVRVGAPPPVVRHASTAAVSNRRRAARSAPAEPTANGYAKCRQGAPRRSSINSLDLRISSSVSRSGALESEMCEWVWLPTVTKPDDTKSSSCDQVRPSPAGSV
jgi:hypothetical protein